LIKKRPVRKRNTSAAWGNWWEEFAAQGSAINALRSGAHESWEKRMGGGKGVDPDLNMGWDSDQLRQNEAFKALLSDYGRE